MKQDLFVMKLPYLWNLAHLDGSDVAAAQLLDTAALNLNWPRLNARSRIFNTLNVTGLLQLAIL